MWKQSITPRRAGITRWVRNVFSFDPFLVLEDIQFMMSASRKGKDIKMHLHSSMHTNMCFLFEIGAAQSNNGR